MQRLARVLCSRLALMGGCLALTAMLTGAPAFAERPARLAQKEGSGSGKDASEKDAAPAGETAAAKDQLILRSGRVVVGYVLEENDQEVKMRVVVSGIQAVTTYAKADILELKRGAVPVEGEGAAAASGKKSTAGKKGADASDDQQDKDEASSGIDDSATNLYILNLEGRFGFDISATSVREAFEAADKEFGDLIDGTGHLSNKKVVDPAKRDQNVVVVRMKCFSEEGFGSIFTAEKVAPAFEEQIVDKGRRVVFWVDQATSAAAYVPFMSPEIYFTSKGRMGGLPDYDEFESGDDLVNEKLIGAYLGAAEGFAIKGGYGDHILALRAMMRKQFWLSVRFEGGRPIYIDRLPEERDGPLEQWTILSDDGEGDNADDEDSLKGNDLFLLEPDWAEKLGISDGVADTIDDLAFRLGVASNYKAIKKNKGQRAIDSWKEGIENALDQIRQPRQGSNQRPGKLWREFEEAGSSGGNGFDDRKRVRGRQIAILREIRSIVLRYKEVFDPEGQYVSQLDARIAEIQLEAERDARDQRRGGGRSGGSGGGGGGGGPIR